MKRVIIDFQTYNSGVIGSLGEFRHELETLPRKGELMRADKLLSKERGEALKEEMAVNSLSLFIVNIEHDFDGVGQLARLYLAAKK